jgi:hypothetical protein
MSWWPIIRKHQPLEKPKRRYGGTQVRPWAILIGALKNSNLHTIIALVLIGLLLLLNFIFRFPSLGGVISEYNQF